MNKRQIAYDFLRYPFRFYFLLAAGAALPAASAWAAASLGFWPLAEDPLAFHIFGFLNLFGSAAFAGFVFTAVPEWTHHTGRLTRHAAATSVLWFAGAALGLFSVRAAAWLFSVFWLYLAVFAAVLSVRVRDSRQTGMVVMLACILALNTAYALSPRLLLLQQTAHVFMIGVVLVMFRIGKALGQKALESGGLAHCSFMPNPYYRNISVWFLYLYVGANLFLNDAQASGWLSLAAGLAVLGRLREWHFPVLWRQAYVRWYCLTLACIAAGYIWQGGGMVLGRGNPVLPFHLIMIGGFILMAVQVFNIAGTIHSGLTLPYPVSGRVSMGLVLGAALSRSLGVAAGGDYPWFALYLPALLLSLAFSAYIPVFYRIFSRNRAVAVKPAEKTLAVCGKGARQR